MLQTCCSMCCYLQHACLPDSTEIERVLQCVAVCCNMLQRVAVCRSMLQYVAVCRSVFCNYRCVLIANNTVQHTFYFCVALRLTLRFDCVTMYRSVLQYVAVCCSVLQYIALFAAITVSFWAAAMPSQLHRNRTCVTERCCVLQRVAACCSVFCMYRCVLGGSHAFPTPQK